VAASTNHAGSKPTAAERLDRRGGLIEVLRPLSWLFGAVASLRSIGYDHGGLTSTKVDVPIVCVGNIVAGGTGKTPMVVEVVRRLQERGLRPGILSRGYGKAGVAGAGSDEAQLYAELLGELPRVAMPDRIEGARRLIEAGADVVVMDDGFQHRRLWRDLDLVLIDATRPWGMQRGPRAFLPRGLMRESPRALRRCGAVVLSRVDLVSQDSLDELELELEAWAPGVPRLLARHRATRLVGLDGEAVALDWLDGRAVMAVSGIGNPRAFEATLVGLGANLVGRRRFEDHHEYTATEFASWEAEAGAGVAVVTTAKDAVKLRHLPNSGHASEVLALEIEMELTRGVDVLDALLASLPRSQAGVERDALHEGLHG